jgi:hypothetical protein
MEGLWLADDAVPCEPVSRISLLTGRFTGSFSKIGILDEIPSLIAQQKQWLGRELPRRKNREIN